jgi:hypothetical protein
MIVGALCIGYLQMANKEKRAMGESRKSVDGLPKTTGSTMIDKP